MFTFSKLLGDSGALQNLLTVANAKSAYKAAYSSLVLAGSARPDSQEADVSRLLYPSYADRSY